DRRTGTPVQQAGDIWHALFRLRMQAVPALGVEAVATQFDEAGAGPDVGLHAEILLQQLGRGDHLAQDRAGTEQLHARLALLRLAAILERVHALDDPFLATLRHVRVRVVLVHHG